MSESLQFAEELSRQQKAMRAKCFHPSGSFVEFNKEEIEQSVPKRFEKTVQTYPNRLAVKTENDPFTYAQLNRAANQIANALLARRDTREEPIAILLENDAPLIAAILGVLKAGKIYVPLDSSLPRTRLAYIIEDAQASLLITNTKNLSLARELTQKRVPLINLDELDPTLSAENPGLPIPPDTLTWILYTSGSTGQPKGVVQNHRNVLHFVRNYTNGLHICPEDRLTLLFSCSANGAAHDTFSALLTGASLYPLNVKESGPARLSVWLRQNHLTLYCSVPTLFRHFVESLAGIELFPDLRLIKLIGEPVSKRDVQLYQKHFSRECLLINRLGSTETGSIRWYFINKETSIEESVVPVGYPVEDNEALLLDDLAREVPAGDIGEIAVKSRYVSPGYWRRPDLTRTVFLPTEGGERVYRTGDIGRLLPDGRLLCLGRKDSQVKIRGHRVEIAEIEMAFLNLGMIKAAVVTASKNRPEDARLVAYLLPKEDPPPTVTKLRRALSEILPDHMIPSLFVFLDNFPLAPNGKLDRNALPDPGSSRPELDAPYIPPETPVEKQLAEIWSEVLSLDPVGVHDNFFELGGHSLLATQVISRAHKTFEVEIPLRTLFDNPTLAELATQIAQAEAKKVAPGEMADILDDVESLSDEEVERLLAQKSSNAI